MTFFFFFGNYFYWLPGEIPPYQPNQYPHHEKGGRSGPQREIHYPTKQACAHHRYLVATREQSEKFQSKSSRNEYLYICYDRLLKAGAVLRKLWAHTGTALQRDE